MNYEKCNEYKNSGIEWIGKIPKDWEIIKIKFISFVYTGNSISDDEKDNYSDNENAIPYIATKDISILDHNIDYNNGMYIPCDNKNFKIAPIKSILLCIEGGSAGKKIAYTKKQVCYVNKLCNFITNKNYDSRFLYYVLQSDAFLVDFNLNISGLIGGVPKGIIKNIFIPFPKIVDQQLITNYLDNKCSLIDNYIETQNKIIEKLKEYKKSIITEAVTKGLDKNAKMKDSGIEWIGEIPEGWEVKRTKFASISLTKGNGITKEDVDENGDIQCIRYGEIYSQYENIVLKTFSRTNLNSITSPKHITKGDIIFAGTGELIEEIGKNILYFGDEPCLAGGDIIILKHNQNPIFFNYALSSHYAQSQKSFGKIKLKVVHISASNIGNIIIALPSLKEQKQIAEYLYARCKEIDRMIINKNQIIGKLIDYKKSLIYECVTGKRRVI